MIYYPSLSDGGLLRPSFVTDTKETLQSVIRIKEEQSNGMVWAKHPIM